MQIVKLDATDSTNSYLKKLWRTAPLEDFTVVTAESQHTGRGQMGTKWVSESGKNLVFSVLKKIKPIPATNQFQLTMCVSLAILCALEKLGVAGLRIKWPNDIMSGNHKICGILIESMISGQHLETTIVGIGLNVNQEHFPGLPNASSLRNLLGHTIARDRLLDQLLGSLKMCFEKLEAGLWEHLRQDYEIQLFGMGQTLSFEVQGRHELGSVSGVLPNGKLQIVFEDGTNRAFGLKEISFRL